MFYCLQKACLPSSHIVSFIYISVDLLLALIMIIFDVDMT